jgi:HEAT repeat protein
MIPIVGDMLGNAFQPVTARRVMKKRPSRWACILLGFCLAGLSLLFLFPFFLPRPCAVLLGQLRGESFHGGLPTSYWRRAVEDWIRNGGRCQCARGIGKLIYQLDTSVLPARLQIGRYGCLDLNLPEDDAESTALLTELQPLLLQLLKDEDAEVRRGAADFLRMTKTIIDPKRASMLVHGLVEATQDGDAGVRQTAVDAIGQLRLEAPISVPALINSLKDVEVRNTAEMSLGEFGPDACSAVPDLVELLKDSNLATRRLAAGALGDIGPGAKAAIPDLRIALEDRSDLGHTGVPMHRMAAEALKKIDPDAESRDGMP